MSELKQIRDRQYRIDHKDELALKKQLYYQAKKVHIREIQKQYQDEHREAIKIKAQEYYIKHQEIINARSNARALPEASHVMKKKF